MELNNNELLKKIISIDNIQSISATGKKLTLVGGCFDLFHFGHLMFLYKAKSNTGTLVIALEPDEFIVKRKHKSPVHTQEQRALMLAALSVVDLIITLPFFKSDKDYEKLVYNIKPSVIAITEGDTRQELKKQYAEAVGGRLEIVKYVPEFSSTNLKTYASISRD